MSEQPKRDDAEQNTGNLGNDEASSESAPPATEGGKAAASGQSEEDN